MKEIIGVITIILSLIGYIPYLFDVLRHKTKPHIFSWLTWSIVAILAFLGQWSAGGGAGSWSAGVVALMAIIITLFAFKNGVIGNSLFDKISFVIALAAIIPWYLTKSPTISITIATLIDAAALLPTVRKTVKHPASETFAMYFLNVIRQSMVLTAMGQYNLATVLYPVYSLVTNSLMSLIIAKPKFAKRSRRR